MIDITSADIEQANEQIKRGHVVQYRYDGSARTASGQWDVEHLIQKIRSHVEAELAHVESKINRGNNKNAFAGAKTTVFREFAVLIRDVVNLDPLIRQAIKDECAAVLEDARNAKKRAQWAESEYNRFFEELKQERDADPAVRRLRDFVEVLNTAIPLPNDSRGDYGGSARVQALRSRGLALAAFNGMKVLGGSGKYEEPQTKTSHPTDDLPL
jgi:hypothetical protein